MSQREVTEALNQLREAQLEDGKASIAEKNALNGNSVDSTTAAVNKRKDTLAVLRKAEGDYTVAVIQEATKKFEEQRLQMEQMQEQMNDSQKAQSQQFIKSMDIIIDTSVTQMLKNDIAFAASLRSDLNQAGMKPETSGKVEDTLLQGAVEKAETVSLESRRSVNRFETFVSSAHYGDKDSTPITEEDKKYLRKEFGEGMQTMLSRLADNTEQGKAFKDIMIKAQKGELSAEEIQDIEKKLIAGGVSKEEAKSISEEMQSGNFSTNAAVKLAESYNVQNMNNVKTVFTAVEKFQNDFEYDVTHESKESLGYNMMVLKERMIRTPQEPNIGSVDIGRESLSAPSIKANGVTSANRMYNDAFDEVRVETGSEKMSVTLSSNAKDQVSKDEKSLFNSLNDSSKGWVVDYSEYNSSIDQKLNVKFVNKEGEAIWARLSYGKNFDNLDFNFDDQGKPTIKINNIENSSLYTNKLAFENGKNEELREYKEQQKKASQTLGQAAFQIYTPGYKFNVSDLESQPAQPQNNPEEKGVTELSIIKPKEMQPLKTSLSVDDKMAALASKLNDIGFGDHGITGKNVKLTANDIGKSSTDYTYSKDKLLQNIAVDSQPSMG